MIGAYPGLISKDLFGGIIVQAPSMPAADGVVHRRHRGVALVNRRPSTITFANHLPTQQGTRNLHILACPYGGRF